MSNQLKRLAATALICHALYALPLLGGQTATQPVGGATNAASAETKSGAVQSLVAMYKLTVAHDEAERLKKLRRYAGAVRAYERAIALAPTAFGRDHLYTALLVNNLAMLYQSMVEYAKAEPLFLRSLKIKEARLGKDHLEVAWSLINMAGLYESMGEYAKAEPLYLRSLNIREAKLGKDHVHVAMTLVTLARLYQSILQHGKAERLYHRSLRIFEAKLGKDHVYVAGSLLGLAQMYTVKREYAKAEAFLLRGLAIFKAKLGKDHPSTMIAMDSLAQLYKNMHQYAKAESIILRVLAFQKAKLGKDHPDVGTTLYGLALLYHKWNRRAKAKPLYQQALRIQEAAHGKNSPSLYGLLECMAWFYDWEDQWGDHEKAWTYSSRAAELLLQAQSRGSSTAIGRAMYYGQLGDYWGTMSSMAVCMGLKLGKSFDALKLLERHRARGLRQLLAESRARPADAMGQRDSRRVEAAMAKINALRVSLDRKTKQGHAVGKIREAIRRAEKEYDQCVAELGRKHQQFVATELARGLTSAEIARSPALDEATAAIGWVWSYDRLWGYVVRPTGVKWVDLSKHAGREAGKRLVLRVLSAVRGSGATRPPAADLNKAYRAWVAPLEAHLRGIGNLIVIADDWSAHLPLEMLLTKKPPNGLAVTDWPWLAQKYRISYAPSCTTLDILSRQRKKRGDRKWTAALFALADPPFSADQLTRMKAKTDLPPGQLFASTTKVDQCTSTLTRLLSSDLKAIPPRLPGTRREVRLIAGVLGEGRSTLLVGPQASERGLAETNKAGKLKQYRYIHLATHGFANDTHPAFSGLVLARAPADKDYDGILHMREVFQLKLDADLVVLSACRTGLGTQLVGEGMLGLSTAFFHAGAQSIVMSLWNVPDAPTALLMHRFYSNLKANKTKPAALREAKKWLRNLTLDDLKKLGRTDPMIGQLTRGLGKPTTTPKGHRVDIKPFAHPHYWAGFILTGDPK